MPRLFRIIWVHCKNEDKLHKGPILYRNRPGEEIRPYTEGEALAVATKYNVIYKRLFHEVLEVANG